MNLSTARFVVYLNRAFSLGGWMSSISPVFISRSSDMPTPVRCLTYLGMSLSLSRSGIKVRVPV